MGNKFAFFVAICACVFLSSVIVKCEEGLPASEWQTKRPLLGKEQRQRVSKNVTSKKLGPQEGPRKNVNQYNNLKGATRKRNWPLVTATARINIKYKQDITQRNIRRGVTVEKGKSVRFSNDRSNDKNGNQIKSKSQVTKTRPMIRGSTRRPKVWDNRRMKTVTRTSRRWRFQGSTRKGKRNYIGKMSTKTPSGNLQTKKKVYFTPRKNEKYIQGIITTTKPRYINFNKKGTSAKYATMRPVRKGGVTINSGSNQRRTRPVRKGGVTINSGSNQRRTRKLMTTMKPKAISFLSGLEAVMKFAFL